MYILHIETSTKICSVALSDGNELLGALELVEGMNHTALLAPSIEELIKSKSIRPSDLTAISVSSGPGSYTGLRVGSSTAKAMAYSLDKPIIAVPTLFALAKAGFNAHPEARFALPMIDARRNEVYTALYDRGMNEIIPVSSLILEDNTLREILPGEGHIVICGDGAGKINAENISEHIITDLSICCSAVHLIEPAYSKYLLEEFSDPIHFVPFYLKPPNITQQRSVI